MKRTGYEILIEILGLCRVPRRVTEIVYQCNLNFGIYRHYLNKLLERGFVEEVNKRYTITELGTEKLNVLDPAMALILTCLA